MRLTRLTAALCLSAALLTACETDFDVTADPRDVPVIYGLLNVNDSVQQIQITRTFLNEDGPVQEAAASFDSIYYDTTEINVYLSEFNRDGNFVRNYPLYAVDYESGKEPGTFAYPEYRLYETRPNQPELKFFNSYEIVVENSKSGNVARSRTEPVENTRSSFPADNGTIDFRSEVPYLIIWNTGTNAAFYNLSVTMEYAEYPAGNRTDSTIETVTWTAVTYQTTPNTGGADEMKYSLSTAPFFSAIENGVPVDPNVERIPRRLYFNYEAGGAEIYDYRLVQTPSIGIVQKRPDYTNITNGLGIFSARTVTDIKLKFTPELKDYLVTNFQFEELNFVRR